ncbi:endo-1,3-alpha-glucanase family glycosylhydrolase [Mycobacterium servetii]|uniref:Endo-1,3-alpha-glucanase family glycosylhydrolase n=1 Tax=Mycobacterium servetii TaxID=3237418 RepID=A0ABV4BWX9_9MYCO
MRSTSFRRLAAWTCLLLLAVVLALPWAPPPRCAERMPAQPGASTPYLPFDMDEAPTQRKVFAHYMPNLPISIDNKNGDEDYYAQQYLAVNGENGVHAAYGGLLRDRPLPRAHSSNPDWRVADLEAEIGQAKSVGIDGFAVDVLAPRSASDDVDRLLRATEAMGNFTVLITADISSPLGAMAPADFAADIAPYLTAPGAFHLSDGRAVLGAFAAERQSTEWWVSVISTLRDKSNVDVAFVPTFLDVADNLERFAGFSYGFSEWGGRSPNAMAVQDSGHGSPVDVIRRAHQLGKLWMQPVPFQDNRPRSGIFVESANGVTNRLAWQLAEQQHAEWVQLLTWNDYVETTAMAPSVAHGWRILDMNAYDIACFKFGGPPRIVRNALYLSYRAQPFGALPVYPESSLMHLLPTSVPARDMIEVVAFATGPSRVVIKTGPHEYSCDVPEGRGICTFPLSLGPIAAEMWRDGAVVATARSNADVTNTPYVQDLQYRVVGGLR